MIVICLYGRALLWVEYRFICRDAFPSIDCPFRNLKRVIPIYVSVHVFLIVHTDLFHGDSKSTDLFFAGRSLPESTVHSKLSLWYWCYVHVFFIVCYKYTNIFIKYIVLLYFFIDLLSLKQIQNWMLFVISILTKKRVLIFNVVYRNTLQWSLCDE